MKAFKKLTAAALSLILVFSASSALAAEERQTNIIANSLIDAVIANIEQNYKFETDRCELYRSALREIIASDPQGLTEIALQGIYNALDKHSVYFTQEEFDDFIEDVSGEFCGIGVTIMAFDEGLVVTEVHKGSSAESAGIKPEDIIISADGVDIRGMELETARSYIVGLEGTKVTVGVMRGEEELSFTLTRGVVTTISGTYQILDGNIGYIQLSSFDEHSPEFMAEALDALAETENIIIDLRYNPGGSLEALQKIASLTLPKGPVMHLEYKDEANNTSVMNDTDGFSHKLVVLVNNYTASAAEAFSAAVQDYDAGVIVGEVTTGKGTMQTVHAMRLTGGGYKLTVAEYLSPDKRTINNIGVEPDFYSKYEIKVFNDDDFEPLDYKRKPTIGFTGKDVLAIEQRLDLLGYSVGIPDEEYDENTFYAVKKFQEAQGLYPYGVCDITTQLRLYSVLQTEEVAIDKPLAKAIELAKGDLAQTIKEASAERAEAEKAAK